MVCPRRAGVPFGLPHKKEPKKVSAQETGLSWLALRRREANSHATGVLIQVPPVAPNAAPSARPNPLGGSLSKIALWFWKRQEICRMKAMHRASGSFLNKPRTTQAQKIYSPREGNHVRDFICILYA